MLSATGKLPVKGRCIGAVETISAGAYIGAKPIDEGAHFSDFISICKEWCRIIASTASYLTGEDPVLAGLHTITSHKMFCHNGEPLKYGHPLLWFQSLLGNDTIYEHRNLIESMAVGNHSQSNHRDSAGETLDDAGIIQAVQRYVNYKANYAFFTLDSGYFGSAFNTCCEGDDIYLLAGLDVPCVLRSQGDAYRFVALAHVHGVMEGQLWPENERDLEGLTLV
ncbi:hypothetical protein F4678DRAFT_482805 [Xylaria arbuscula]|nr:hypothetical protein F4678DRAFT_482805 [Xylaria arbuscula]